MNLCVLYVEYDNEKYPYSWDILKIYLNNLKEHCSIQLINLNNNSKIIHDRLNIKARYYDDLNNEWEFGAWQKGIEYLRESNIDYDAVLFVNDSFIRADYDILKNMFKKETIEECIKKQAFIGKVDRLDRKDLDSSATYRINDCDVKQWIRTCIFYMPKEIVENINFVTFKKEDMYNFVPEKYNKEIFLYNADVNLSLQRQILQWLTRKWHGAFEINEETWEFFVNKLMAIFNEKFLYVNVKNKGFKIIDYRDLS